MPRKPVVFKHENLKLAFAGFYAKHGRMPVQMDKDIEHGPAEIRGKKWATAIKRLGEGAVEGLEGQFLTPRKYFEEFCADIDYEEAMKAHENVTAQKASPAIPESSTRPEEPKAVKSISEHDDSDEDTEDPDDDDGYEDDDDDPDDSYDEDDIEFDDNGQPNIKPNAKKKSEFKKPPLTRDLILNACVAHKRVKGEWPRVPEGHVRGNMTFSGKSVLAASKWELRQVQDAMIAGSVDGIPAGTRIEDLCNELDFERFQKQEARKSGAKSLSARVVFAAVSQYISKHHHVPDVKENADDILVEANPETGQFEMSVAQVDIAFRGNLVEYFGSQAKGPRPDCLNTFMVARGLALHDGQSLKPSPDIVFEEAAPAEKPLDPAA